MSQKKEKTLLGFLDIDMDLNDPKSLTKEHESIKSKWPVNSKVFAKFLDL